MRGLVFLMMIAIMLQAFFSPGLRILVRTHFHVATATVEKQPADDAHGSVNTDTDAQSHTHPHPHAHSHSHLASHEHDVESNDVVYVDTHDSESPSGHTTNRVALDLDGILLHRDLPSVDTSTYLTFAGNTQRFRSRVEPPLERPPRIGS